MTESESFEFNVHPVLQNSYASVSHVKIQTLRHHLSGKSVVRQLLIGRPRLTTAVVYDEASW
jgi:hypothetical protein